MLPQKKKRMHKIFQTVFAGPYYIKKDYKNVSRIKKLQKKKKKERKKKKSVLRKDF